MTRDVAKHKITAVWWVLPGISKAAKDREQDRHWDWTKIVGERRQQSDSECWAVETPTGEVQAVVAYLVNTKSLLEVRTNGEPAGAVYCEFLATAPRNRSRLVAAPAWRGGGTALVRFMIAHSYRLGLQGRVNLASLPDRETLDFYLKLGFHDTGRAEDGMAVLEIGSQEALRQLAEAGWLNE